MNQSSTSSPPSSPRQTEKLRLIVEPNEIYFSGPLGLPGPPIESLTLRNENRRKVAFRIRTLDPERYTIRPRRGTINAQEAATIKIRFRPTRGNEIARLDFAKQRLLIMSIAALESEEDDDDDSETGDRSFARADSSEIGYVKVKCRFQQAPPKEKSSSSGSSSKSPSESESIKSFNSVGSQTSAKIRAMNSLARIGAASGLDAWQSAISLHNSHKRRKSKSRSRSKSRSKSGESSRNVVLDATGKQDENRTKSPILSKSKIDFDNCKDNKMISEIPPPEPSRPSTSSEFGSDSGSLPPVSSNSSVTTPTTTPTTTTTTTTTSYSPVSSSSSSSSSSSAASTIDSTLSGEMSNQKSQKNPKPYITTWEKVGRPREQILAETTTNLGGENNNNVTPPTKAKSGADTPSKSGNIEKGGQKSLDTLRSSDSSKVKKSNNDNQDRPILVGSGSSDKNISGGDGEKDANGNANGSNGRSGRKRRLCAFGKFLVQHKIEIVVVAGVASSIIAAYAYARYLRR